jgi:hypothetical protein
VAITMRMRVPEHSSEAKNAPNTGRSKDKGTERAYTNGSYCCGSYALYQPCLNPDRGPRSKAPDGSAYSTVNGTCKLVEQSDDA